MSAHLPPSAGVCDMKVQAFGNGRPTGVPSVGSTRGLAGWVHAASSRVFPGARPRPVLHSVAESGSHWIVFDVPGNASFVVPVANSAAKVISGPESRTAPVQKAICCLCAAALDAPDGRSEILISQGAKRDVHVIRHQHPGAQFIPRLPHPFPEGIGDDIGNVAPLQPPRSCRQRVEELVQFDEFGSVAGPEVGHPCDRKRPIQPPGQEIRRARARGMFQPAMEIHSRFDECFHHGKLLRRRLRA